VDDGGTLSVPELVSDVDEPLDGELLLVPDPLDVPLPAPAELLPLEPDPLEELSLFGVSTVVVVVTVPEEPEAPEALLPEDGLAPEEDFVGSFVVVVVVVCPYVIVAVPISDKKIAIGNFFMLAP